MSSISNMQGIFSNFVVQRKAVEKMTYSIKLDHKLQLIRYKHPGLIYGADIEKAWGDFLTYEEFTKLGYGLLSDYRGGTFKMPLKDLSEIVAFLQKLEPIIRGKKQALIVDEPYSVAASMIFGTEVYKQIGFIVQVFNTEKEALKWLAIK